MKKRIICCDFDGVLHSYTSGWQGATVISDDPVPGSLEWIIQMTDDSRFELAIYSSRSKEPGAIDAMKAWLIRHMTALFAQDHPVESLAASGICSGSCHLPDSEACGEHDDRRSRVPLLREFPTPEWLLAFQPWTKAQLRSDLQYERPTPSRLEEIEAALTDTPFADRDSPDHAIGELLTEIYYLRGGRR